MSDFPEGHLRPSSTGPSQPQPPLQVLLIGETPEGARPVEESLRKSPPEIHLRRSEDLAESPATLERFDAEERPDVIVLDLDVSENAVPQTVQHCAQSAPSTGIVVLADDEHRDAARTIQESGDAEVLWKEALPPQLVGKTLRWAAERRRMQTELREHEERHRSITDAVTEGLYQVAPGDGLVYANQRFVELFGYDSVEAVLEAEPADLYMGDHDPFEGNEKSLEAREVKCRRSDGTIFPGRLSGTVTRNSDGEIQYFTGAVTDLTERKARERDRRRRYEAIFNQTYQFVGLMEPDGTLIEANETALEFGGIDPDDVLGKPFWEAHWWQIDDDTQRELRDAIDRAAEGEFVRYEVDVQGEAEVITIDFSIRPITDDDGEVTYLIPEGRNITELKTLKRQKRELERYRTIAENLPVGVFRTTPDGDIVNMNSTFASLFGADSKAQLRDHTSQDVWADPTKRPDLMEEIQEKEVIEEKEVRLETLDGEPRWMEVTFALTEEEEGAFLDGILQDVTGRRRRERKLEQQTELLSSLLDALPVGVLVEDESREVLEVNKQYLDLWDISASPKEVVGWSTERIVDKVRGLVEDAETFIARTQELFEEREPVRNEEIGLVDGRTIARSHCLFDLPDGHGYLWVYRDITDQKRRERELERARLKFQRVFEESSNAIFITDIKNDQILDCNRAAADLVEGSREELRSLSPSELHPHNADAFKKWAEAVLDQGTGRTDAITCRRLDGEIIPVEMSAGVAEFEGTRCLVNNVVDITERRERKQKLEQEKRRFETIFENSNDAIFILDVENNDIKDANPQAAHLLGYPREELVSSVSISDVHADHMDEFQMFIDSVRKEGHGWTDELPCITKDGDTVEAAISMSTIELNDTTYLLSNVRDITDRKQRERELERYERLVEKLPVGVFRSTASGEFVDLNAAAEDLYGGSAEQLREAGTDAVYTNPETRTALLETLRREGKVEGRLLRMQTLEGEERWIRATINLAEGDGERYLEGIVQDVTERRERERRLEAVFNQTFQLTCLMERDGTIVQANGRILQFFEIGRTDVIGRKAWDAPWIQTEEAAERTREAIRTAGEGKVARYEREVPTGDQNHRILDNSFRPITNEDGEVTLLIWEARDITEQKQREERLHRRRQMVESLYDATTQLLTAERREVISDRIHGVFEDVFDYALVTTGFREENRIVPMQTNVNSNVQVPPLKPQSLEGNSVSARALRTGKTIVEDVQSLENPTDYGELQSILATPMKDYGVVMVGQAKSTAFNPFELRLIEVLVSYAASVLDRLDREQELVKAKEEAESRPTGQSRCFSPT